MFFEEGDVKGLQVSVSAGQVKGKAELRTTNQKGAIGYQADIFGHVEGKNGKLTRFDLVAKGFAWGEGDVVYGVATKAPRGKYTLAIAFALADPACEIANLPPKFTTFGFDQGVLAQREAYLR
jgi:hypothetical protein